MNKSDDGVIDRSEVVVTGMGVVTANGVGVRDFEAALRSGSTGVRQVTLLNRLLPAALLRELDLSIDMVGSELSSTVIARIVSIAKRAPQPVKASLLAAAQAWGQSKMTGDRNDERCSVIVCGSNLTTLQSVSHARRDTEQLAYVPSRYAATYFDTDHVGCLSEAFGIHGEGFTVGGASASGNVGLLHAFRHVRDGYADRCLVVGAMAELSDGELQAFAASGALAIDWNDLDASAVCRPFDRDRRGFVYGQGSAALMIESRKSALARNAAVLGRILGGAQTLDGNRGTEPSGVGQVRAMMNALADAQLDATAVDYINGHGTSSRLGDEVEAASIASVYTQTRPWVNSTKAMTGHCLGAAGLVEAVACLIQLRGGFVHPNLNLATPIRDDIRFAGAAAVDARLQNVANHSFGFGGINTSLLFGKERS